ncbi:nitrate- and nitrite sensing domain-containing protein [Streptomyces sp. DSM 41982]|uniref:histidine kinase n=2 Tax=Streptomyces TaxID=1883 RepID=A0ABD5E504_9ACTN|nr:nitrate- and nitrite sensing domain-containing protein [Streptomyces sp. DSM 41982]MDT0416448.1 nitrate- and nitrite sensing domain-containing protein [Streptomyces sp. DSM 41982]
MRRSKKGSGPAERARGNFTPLATAEAPAAVPESGSPTSPSARGSRLSPRNWRVPTRLNAILLIPVIVGLVMGGFQVKGSIDTWREAEDAEHTARLVQAAMTYGNRLIEERDVSAEPLLKGEGVTPAVTKARTATDVAAREFTAAAAEMPHTEGLDRRMADFRKVEPGLDALRKAAYTKKLSGVRTEEGYTEVQHPLMEFANELGLGTGNITSYGRTVYAISLSKAALSLQRSIGMHLWVAPGPDAAGAAKQRTALPTYAYLEGIAVEEYTSGGTPADVAALDEAMKKLAADGKKANARAAVAAKEAGKKYVAPPDQETMVGLLSRPDATQDRLTAQGVTPASWWATTTPRFDAYRTIESDLTRKAVTEAAGIVDDAKRDTLLVSAAVVAALLLAFLIAGMMARQMSKSMRRLRTEAFGIAQKRLPALVDQLSRTDPGRVDTRVTPLPITSTDEIGEVARAFDQVHREAVRLASEQALLRGNINAIFTNLSRRNQSLIEGQLTLITDLENNEAEPEQLENLFKLDHLATRMRRNGENLLVLAGEEPGRRWDQPVPLVDVLRAASSEVEQYERVELSGVPEAEIHGRAVTDLVHLLSELLENATTFSSPQTKVRVTATRMPDGRVVIEIHDKGIGLNAEDFADINHRLANPPVVDAAISQRMGLFVVGRLSDRHGIRVQLRPSGEQAGTTSLVMLPESITHGGGGQAGQENEFTVSSMIPGQPHAAPGAGHAPLRTAAELGFDDTRYGAGQPALPAGENPAGLDPVGRSLFREERRAALEAQTHPQEPAPERHQDGNRPLFRDEAAPGPYEGGGPYGNGGTDAPYGGSPGYPGQAPQPSYGNGGEYAQGYPASYGNGPAGYAGEGGTAPYPDGNAYAPQPPYPGFTQGAYPGAEAGTPGAEGGYPAREQDEYAPQSAYTPYAEPTHAPYPPDAAGTGGYPAAPHQEEWQHGPAQSGAPGGEAESPARAPQEDADRVGFGPHGGAAEQEGGVTEAGLPRRVPAAGAGEVTDRQGWDNGPSGTPPQDGTPAGEQPRAEQDPGSSAHAANEDRAQRASGLRRPQAGGVTSSGLPRRVPRANLVEGAAEEQSPQGGPQVSRAPEDVRGRLSRLRNGVARGRTAGSDTNGTNGRGSGPDSTYDQER